MTKKKWYLQKKFILGVVLVIAAIAGAAGLPVDALDPDAIASALSSLLDAASNLVPPDAPLAP